MTFFAAMKFEPRENENKVYFVLWKVLHIFVLTSVVTFVSVYNEYFLYHVDTLGLIADHYRVTVSSITIFVIIIEPLLFYSHFVKLKKSFEEFNVILRGEFRNLIDETNTSVHKSLKKLCIQFFLFHFFCEFYFISFTIGDAQATNFYIFNIPIWIIIHLKVSHLLFYMLKIEKSLKTIRVLVKSINKDIESNKILNSKVFCKIINRKLNALLKLYEIVHKICACFNASNISQLAIFLAMKFFLMADFYWIAFVTMSTSMKNHQHEESYIYGRQFFFFYIRDDRVLCCATSKVSFLCFSQILN
jgi:hypothetical protein